MTKHIISDYRTTFSLIFVAISGIIMSGHLTGSVFPWQLVFLFLGVISILISIHYNQSTPILILAIIVLGVGFRVASMQIPVPIAGDDATSNLVWISQMMESGSIDQIQSGFYTDAPIHYIFIAISSIVFGVGAESGIHVYGPLMGIIVPLVAVVFAKEIGIKETYLLALAAVLAVITTEAMRRTHRPLAQTHASIFWWLFLASVMMYVRHPNNRSYILLTFFTVSAAFTHKLPLPIIVIFISFLLIINLGSILISNKSIDKTLAKHFMSIFVVLGLVTFSQWLYATDLIDQIVARISAFIIALLSDSGGVGGPSYVPSAAVPARPGLISEFYQYPAEYALYFERSHAIILLIASGFGWLVLCWNRGEKEHWSVIQVLLVAAAICVFLITLGQVSVGAMNPTRPLLLIEPVLVVLVIGSLWTIQRKYNVNLNQSYPKALYIFMIVLVVSQVFAAKAAADYHNTPRYYLNEPEQQAQEKMCTYTEEEIHVDQEYWKFSTCEKFNRISRTSEDPWYNAEIEPDEQGIVMYRHHVDVYLGVQNRWRLTWDPAEELPQEYHEVYDNGAVSTYASPDR